MPNVDPSILPSYPQAYGGKEVSQALANIEVAAALGGNQGGGGGGTSSTVTISAWESTAIITRISGATTYSQNDVYGGVFELTNIGSNGGFIFLSSLDIIFNISSLPSGMGTFTVFLYSSSPPSAIVDNALFNISGSFSNGAMTLDRSVILSTSGFSLTAAVTRGGNTVAAELLNINQLFKLTTTSLWGYLVTNTGFTFTGSTNTETAVIRARSFTP